MTNLRFLLRKGLLTSIRDKLTPSDMLRNTKIDGLKFYHWKALPPADMRYPDGRETYDTALSLEGNVAVDVGAHIGSYSLRLAKKFKAVYAFEPNPQNFLFLELNIERNHLQKTVFPLKIAVSDSSGMATLRIPSTQPYAATLAEKHYDYIKFDHAMIVTKVSLDDYFFMHSRGVGKIDYVKIDVEGHELEVLRGMEKIISLHRPTMSVEIHKKQEIINSQCYCQSCQFLRAKYSNIKSNFRPSAEMAHWVECFP